MAADAYFRSVAIDVFGERLGELGARMTGIDPLVVRYESDRWFVELMALMREGPKYCPRVAIGPLPERGVLARHTQFDILHALPVDSPLRRYNLEWRYMDEATMRLSYIRVLTDIFEPYAVALLCDPHRLEALMDLRSRQVEHEWQTEIRDHNEGIVLAKARDAWERKDYRTYLLQMREIAPERQSSLEKAKLKYAKGQVPSD